MITRPTTHGTTFSIHLGADENVGGVVSDKPLGAHRPLCTRTVFRPYVVHARVSSRATGHVPVVTDVGPHVRVFAVSAARRVSQKYRLSAENFSRRAARRSTDAGLRVSRRTTTSRAETLPGTERHVITSSLVRSDRPNETRTDRPTATYASRNDDCVCRGDSRAFRVSFFAESARVCQVEREPSVSLCAFACRATHDPS